MKLQITKQESFQRGNSLTKKENDFFCNTFHNLLFGLVILYTFLIIFGGWLILPKDETVWCKSAQLDYPSLKKYPNPDTNNNPCYHEHTIYLLGMSQFEADFSRRMISSVVFGSLIGYERKAADRPAGVRTMALVCLGACFFTMCGQHAFHDSTQGWDAARVSAAIPSGVGFLGSALIWKSTTKSLSNGRHEVHGLTTAASVWLSASVGIGVGGHLYIISLYAVSLAVFVLRLGPRLYSADDMSYMNGIETESEWDGSEGGNEPSPTFDQSKSDIEPSPTHSQSRDRDVLPHKLSNDVELRHSSKASSFQPLSFHG
mmetsp:Transcript_24825/g.37479  ORF Transcript_24825/g.37479 Transcript_24825/m.37479 type:complete len:316 (+) Transcript_24825:29-976(+)